MLIRHNHQPKIIHSLITFSLFFFPGDLSRIPEILANSVKEGAGLDSDMTDDDDEMSSPVKKGKHRKNPPYRYHVF